MARWLQSSAVASYGVARTALLANAAVTAIAPPRAEATAPGRRPVQSWSPPAMPGRIGAPLLLVFVIAMACSACQQVQPDNGRGRTPQPSTVAASTQATGMVSVPTATNAATAAAAPPAQSTADSGTISRQTATPTQAPIPTAADTAAGTPAPRIESFTAAPGSIRPGDSIELTWSASGGVVTLYRIGARGQPEPLAMELPTSGTYSEPTSPDVRGSVNFLLVIRPSATASEWLDQASVSVAVQEDCATWYFAPAPDTCAQPASQGDAAYQRFEHGAMVWFGPSGSIYVLNDSPQSWQLHEDEFREGDPKSDPAVQPPEGMFQPVRGFGLVWRTATGPGAGPVRQTLGWAVAPEAAYSAALQCDSAGQPMYVKCYLSGPEGEVYELAGNGPWSLR